MTAQSLLNLPRVRPIAVDEVAGHVRISVIEPGGEKRPLLELDVREADRVAGHISATVTEIMNRRRAT